MLIASNKNGMAMSSTHAGEASLVVRGRVSPHIPKASYAGPAATEVTAQQKAEMKRLRRSNKKEQT